MARLAFVRRSAPLILVAGLAAQEPLPSFEAASVKRNVSGEPDGGSAFQPGGRYRAHNIRIRAVIAEAYQVRLYQVVGGPGWLDSDRFDIDAKAAGPEGTEFVPQGPGAPAPPPLPFLMLRRLLQERFNLVAHTETHEGRVYALTLARSDRQLGPGLQRQKEPCSNDRELPTSPPGGFCDGIRRAPGRFVGTGATMRQLAGSLSTIVAAPVGDETTLAGTFNLTLEWTPPSPDDSNVSIFTAVQEQLGLKLNPQRGRVKAMIVDRIEKPTAD